jgi:hypothetical protein
MSTPTAASAARHPPRLQIFLPWCGNASGCRGSSRQGMFDGAGEMKSRSVGDGMHSKLYPHTHTHWVINSIISSGMVSSSLSQMLSPVLECERGTISMGKWKKQGWARGWGGNGVAARGRTWFLTHTQRCMELCLLDPGVSLNLPNPHPRVEDDSEHNSGILFLFFVLSAFD